MCSEQNLAFLAHSGLVMSGLLSAHHCCSRHIITIVDIESKLVRTKVVPPAPVRVATLVWMAAWCSPANEIIVYKYSL